MQYQTFTGIDLKEALGAVRAAYGPGALIGPTRHVRVADQRGLTELRVEVQAAPSSPDSTPWPFSSALLPQKKATSSATTKSVRTKKQIDSPLSSTSDSTPRPAQQPSSLSRMEAQITELREMIETLQAQLPSKQRAQSILSQLGIEGTAARNIGGRLGKFKSDAELEKRLRQRLLGALPAPVHPLASEKPELIACVGPTGVGKTTTLAKMAAQGRLDYGRSVAVVSLDHYRVGAADQWQRYGKLMGVPVFSPKTPAELAEVLTSNTADLLLVDTPSVGSTEDPSMRAFSELSHLARRSTHVFMLLPAWLRGLDAEKMVERYGHLSPTSLIVTKLDESNTIGGVMQAAIGASLPISYLCRGPRVPEHLDATNNELLVESAFLALQSE